MLVENVQFQCCGMVLVVVRKSAKRGRGADKERAPRATRQERLHAGYARQDRDAYLVLVDITYMGVRALTHASLATAYVVARPPTLILRAFHSARTLRTAVDDMEKVNTTQRLAELRRLMKQHQVDIYSVHPSGPYISNAID